MTDIRQRKILRIWLLTVATAGAISAIGLAGSAAGTPRAAAAVRPGPSQSGVIGCVDGAPPPSGGVSCIPAAGTPQLPPTGTGPVQQIRQLVQCGSMMYAVGTFSSISWQSPSGVVSYPRSNAFSFQASPPFAVSGWNPDVNGEVNSIAVGGRHCGDAYLGGTFSRVHGARVRDIAEVSTSAGKVQGKFRHDASDTVETLLLHGGRLLAGGFFTSINGSKRRYYLGLNPTTGVDDGYLRLNISGHYSYPGVTGNRTRLYNQQLSPSGKLLLAEGDFTSVGGKRRQQIFMLSLGTKTAAVTKWGAGEFAAHCAGSEPFYVRDASWSPGQKTIYVADTGEYPSGDSGTGPRSGLCDAAAAFPAVQRAVRHLWVNYTGCDSMYSTATDAAAAYFGGHERWADNAGGCNAPGPGAISAPGMVGLAPADGSVIFDPTRGRGLGADDMLATAAGLWIAGDNAPGGGSCGGKAGYWGICFLPRQ